VLAGSASLADAAATALGNRVRRPEDIEPALDWVMGVPGVWGAAVCLGEKVGLLGDLNLIPI
jgi:ApbE superfamily uncharacterized protein (UPF0280 family)